MKDSTGKKPAKKPYKKPDLVEYGPVEKLTQGGSPGTKTDTPATKKKTCL